MVKCRDGIKRIGTLALRFYQLGLYVSEKLGFDYPYDIDTKMTNLLKNMQL